MTRPLEEHQEDTLARQFGALCGEGPPPDVFAFLDSADETSLREKTDVLLVDQKERIKRDCLLPAEEYLARYPELAKSDHLSLELIANEYRLRREHGGEVSVGAFLTRFPRLKPLLSQILPDSMAAPSGRETTIDVSLESILHSASDDSLKERGDSTSRGQETETISLPPDSLTGVDPQASIMETLPIPRSIVEWNPTPHGMDSPKAATEDTSADKAAQTLPIDPKSLNQMMDEFAQGKSTENGQTLAMDLHLRRRGRCRIRYSMKARPTTNPGLWANSETTCCSRKLPEAAWAWCLRLARKSSSGLSP